MMTMVGWQQVKTANDENGWRLVDSVMMVTDDKGEQWTILVIDDND